MHPKQDSEWDIIIDPQKGVLNLNLNQIWDYRDLVWLFVRRDFVSFYKQTILGPFWFFVQPIFTTSIYIFLFNNLANLSTDDIPSPLFYIAGITFWTYFSETILKVSGSLRDNAGIFGKVYFPRLIMPISLIFSGLFKLFIQIILLIVAMLYYSLTGTDLVIGWQIVFIPFLIFLLALQSFGIGLVISSLTTKYRDLAMLVSFGLQLVMFASPIVYPLSSITGKPQLFISLNPITFIIEAIRFCLFGKGTLLNFGLIYTLVITVFVFFFGVFMFNKSEKSFVDTV